MVDFKVGSRKTGAGGQGEEDNCPMTATGGY